MNKFLIVLLLTGILAVSAQANMLTNGDFNTGDLTGWWQNIPESENQSITVQDVVNYDGTYNAMFVSATDADWMNLGQDFEVNPENLLTLSLVYNKESWAGVGINLKYWDADWATLTEEWVTISGNDVEGTGEWIAFSQDIMTPADAAHLEVKIGAGGWGTVYMEDMSVEVPEPASLLLLGLGGLLLRRK